MEQRKQCFTTLSSAGKHNLETYLKSPSAEVKGFLILLRIMTDEDLISMLNEGQIRIKRFGRPLSTYIISTWAGSASYSYPIISRRGLFGFKHNYCVHAGSENRWRDPLPYTDQIAAMYLTLKYGSLFEFHKRANYL